MIDIAPVKSADADVLAALHRASIAPSWSADELRDLLAGPDVFGFAAPARPDWHAFVIARAAGGEAEILTLVTLKPARRGGFGRALVRAAADESRRRGAHEMFLEVAADNDAAIRLYEGLGFAEVGRRQKYYVRPGESVDALVMRAGLPLR